jgi:5-formyltetrahydrofolate cyclo-ligase
MSTTAFWPCWPHPELTARRTEVPNVDDAKQAIRDQVWNTLDAAAAVRTSTAHGRIPHFNGAEAAAARLAEHPAFQQARTIKVVPDKAQHSVRANALAAGKILYMAVPKLATTKPFRCLDPAELPIPAHEAASSTTAVAMGKAVDIDTMNPVDLIVLGSVAVNRSGARIGKGAGYSDIEAALLTEAGLITPQTLIATTVHSLQVIDTPIPTRAHDFYVDLIVTPEETISCSAPHRPAGILWEQLAPSQMTAIPALRSQWNRRQN